MLVTDFTKYALPRHWETKIPAALFGAPGIAKSEAINQWGRDNDITVITYHGHSIEAFDLRGLPATIKREGAKPMTRFAESDVMATVREALERNPKGVILFFDELLQSGDDVLRALAPAFADERTLGGEKLPDNVLVLAASNTPEWHAGTVSMPGHFPSRVGIYNVTMTVEAWLAWANANGIPVEYKAFAQARPSVVIPTQPPKDLQAPMCNLRSLTRAARIHMAGVKSISHGLPTDTYIQEIVGSLIGPAAPELFAFIKVMDEVPTPESIARDPMKAKLPSETRLDAHYAAMQLCVDMADVDNVEAAFTYVTRLRPELQVAAAKQMVTKMGGKLLNSPALNRWMSSNSAKIRDVLA